MNMVKLRQIMELRRATKAPPLIPPKSKRGSETECKRGPREIVDIHVQIRNFVTAAGTSKSAACIFSESDDGQQGPWKVTTASEDFVKQPSINLMSVFAVEFQFERCQYIKLDICDWNETSVTSLGYTVFSVSELVIRENTAICREVVNDENGDRMALAYISCTLRPKPHSILLQFGSKNLAKKNIIPTSTQIFFEMYRANDQEDGREQNTLLYRSEMVKYAARLSWRAFSLQSTEITGRTLEVICYYRDGKTSKGLVGQFSTDYRALQRGTSPDNSYTLTYENSRNQTKSCGTFEVVRCTEMAVPSFLEFISSGAVINFALAIDFSRPDGAVEEAVIRRYVDDVDLAIRAFGEPMRYFNSSNSYAAFGFGAKIPPQFRESQEFCLNLDTDPYCRGIEGVQGAFKNAFTNVQPITTAHLSHVIYYVSKLAQNAFNRSQSGSPCYHVLIVITRGVFDDIKETVQAVIFASRAPISIIFVGIGEADLTELQRLGTAGMRLNYHGRKPERDCIQYVSVPKCRDEETEINDLKALIAERGLLNIPHQMSMYLTKNGIRPTPGTYQAAHQEQPESLGYSSPPPVTPSALSRLESAVEDSCADMERLTFDGRYAPSPLRSSDASMDVNVQSPGPRHYEADATSTTSLPNRRLPSINSLSEDTRQLEHRLSYEAGAQRGRPPSLSGLRSYSIQSQPSAGSYVSSAVANRRSRGDVG